MGAPTHQPQPWPRLAWDVSYSAGCVTAASDCESKRGRMLDSRDCWKRWSHAPRCWRIKSAESTASPTFRPSICVQVSQNTGKWVYHCPRCQQVTSGEAWGLCTFVPPPTHDMPQALDVKSTSKYAQKPLVSSEPTSLVGSRGHFFFPIAAAPYQSARSSPSI